MKRKTSPCAGLGATNAHEPMTYEQMCVQASISDLLALDLQVAQARDNVVGPGATVVCAELDDLTEALLDARERLAEHAAKVQLPLTCGMEVISIGSSVERLPDTSLKASRVPPLMAQRVRAIVRRFRERAKLAARRAGLMSVLNELAARLGRRARALELGLVVFPEGFRLEWPQPLNPKGATSFAS